MVIDEHFLFSLFFFLFSYKLLFWSERNVSIGVLILTICSAFSLTNLIRPDTYQHLLDSLSQKVQETTSRQPDFNTLFAYGVDKMGQCTTSARLFFGV